MNASPSRTGLYLMIALLALVAGGKAILYDTLDPDSFWHLRVADQLQQDGIGPIVDHLSFASLKTPWTPYSWLAELGMKQLWDEFGYRGTILAQAIMMAGFVAFVGLGADELTRQQQNDEGNPLAVIIATVFAMFLSLPYLSFRPATLAITLLALCGWLLLRDRRLLEQSRAVYWIIPITLLTTNCHFFAIIIPLAVLALLAGAIWERNRDGAFRYSLLLMMTSLACLATPMLPGVIRSMWQYQSADPMVSAGMIAELRPFWTSPVCLVVVVVWVATVAMGRRRIRAGELIWAAGMLILMTRMARMAPAFAPIAAAVLAASLPALGMSALSRQPIHIVLASILVLAMIRLTMAFPDRDIELNRWLNRHGPDTPGYPTAAADFVHDHVTSRSGRLINEFSWGGYLAWTLGPRYQVLVDGRTQLYSPQFWQAIYLSNSANCQHLLHDVNADAAILPAERSRFHDALLALGWRTVFRDERAEVLVPASMNASIIP